MNARSFTCTFIINLRLLSNANVKMDVFANVDRVSTLRVEVLCNKRTKSYARHTKDLPYVVITIIVEDLNLTKDYLYCMKVL